MTFRHVLVSFCIKIKVKLAWALIWALSAKSWAQKQEKNLVTLDKGPIGLPVPTKVLPINGLLYGGRGGFTIQYNTAPYTCHTFVNLHSTGNPLVRMISN